MIHDELLAKIDWSKSLYIDKKDCRPLIKYLDALRAVVELHKPCEDCDDCDDCAGCHFSEQYPCPTIQAIEKELA